MQRHRAPGCVGPSAEVCDGIDNDCDGVVDDSAVGRRRSRAASTTPPCTPGLTACVNGALVCQGGTGPQPEVCDGVDNDCDGLVDEAPLADGAGGRHERLLDRPGGALQPDLRRSTTSSWCPPAGRAPATTSARSPRRATRARSPAPARRLGLPGRQGPAARGVRRRSTTTATAMIDDGNFPGEGGRLRHRRRRVRAGPHRLRGRRARLRGRRRPDARDLRRPRQRLRRRHRQRHPVGGPCTPPYDMNALPGRSQSRRPASPGMLQCDGMGRHRLRRAASGPTPEVCDGIDNDCDGEVDEAGAPPDGHRRHRRTRSRRRPANIGEACGVDAGECSDGRLGLRQRPLRVRRRPGRRSPSSATATTTTATAPSTTQDPNGTARSAARARTAWSTASGCQCAAPCDTASSRARAGQNCERRRPPARPGEPLGSYCVADSLPAATATRKTVTDADDNVLCAPAGTALRRLRRAAGLRVQGPDRLPGPVLRRDLRRRARSAPNYGPNAGTCVADNCFNVPCQGCDKVCNDGDVRIDNPCEPNQLPADEVCKPSATSPTSRCVGSCAGVDCPSGTDVRRRRVRRRPASPPCAAGQACDETQMPPTCVADQCRTRPAAPTARAAIRSPARAATARARAWSARPTRCARTASASRRRRPRAARRRRPAPAAAAAAASTGGAGGRAAAAGRRRRRRASGAWPPAAAAARARSGPARPRRAARAGLLGWRWRSARCARRRSRTRRGARRRGGGAMSAPLRPRVALAWLALAARRSRRGARRRRLHDRGLLLRDCDGDGSSTERDGQRHRRRRRRPRSPAAAPAATALLRLRHGGAGGSGPASPTTAAIEICDGMDNDCNGNDRRHARTSISTTRRPAAPATTTATRSLTELRPGDGVTCTRARARASSPARASARLRAGLLRPRWRRRPASTTASRRDHDDVVCNNKDDDCDGIKDEDVDLCTSTDRLRLLRQQLRRCSTARPTCVHTGAAAVRPRRTPSARSRRATAPAPATAGATSTARTPPAASTSATDQRRRRDLRRRPRQRLRRQDRRRRRPRRAIPQIGAALLRRSGRRVRHARPTPASTECLGSQVVCAGANVLHENDVLGDLQRRSTTTATASPTTAPPTSGGSCGSSNIFPCSFGTLHVPERRADLRRRRRTRAPRPATATTTTATARSTRPAPIRRPTRSGRATCPSAARRARPRRARPAPRRASAARCVCQGSVRPGARRQPTPAASTRTATAR